MSKIALSPYFPGSARCADRYLFHERHRLARGASANVYVALDERDRRIVALKLLHRPGADEPYEQFEDRLLRFRVETEVYAAVQARHPSAAQFIIPTLDANTELTAPRQYHAMALADGSLRDLLVERAMLRSPLTACDVLRYASQVAQGLHAAQRCGYVHRDVKPENILLTREGDERFTAKVTDFGIAKVDDETTTQQGHAFPIGTWGYMSPEQIQRGVERAQGRSDVWSMGVVVYELFTLYPCWRGGGAASLRQEALEGLADRGSERAKRHWAQTEKLQPVDEWLARCLARRPCDRYADPVEAVTALGQCLATAGVDLAEPLVCVSRAPGRSASAVCAGPARRVDRAGSEKVSHISTQPALEAVVFPKLIRAPSLPGGVHLGRGALTLRALGTVAALGVGVGVWQSNPLSAEPQDRTVEPPPLQTADRAPALYPQVTVLTLPSNAPPTVSQSGSPSRAEAEVAHRPPKRTAKRPKKARDHYERAFDSE